MDIAALKTVVEEQLVGTDRFLVEVKVSPANVIEIVIDSDSRLDIETCIALSRKVEENFDREVEDFELTVISAGVGQPVKLLRQYQKLITKPVDVVLLSGEKIRGVLQAASEQQISVSYPEKQAVEGKKRKVEVEITRELAMSEVKSCCEYLIF